MRALPIIVDLFVLLTVFALVLFYAALGLSAPNEETRGGIVFELSASFNGSRGAFEEGVNGRPLVSFNFSILTASGEPSPGSVRVLPSGPDTIRLHVVNGVPGGALHVWIAELEESAFAYDSFEAKLTRMYPSHSTVQQSGPVGRFRPFSIYLSKS